MEKNVVARLFESRKFVVLTLAMIVMTVLVVLGKASFQQFIDALKWLTTTFVASVAAEDVAANLPQKAAPVVTEFKAIELQGVDADPARVQEAIDRSVRKAIDVSQVRP